MEYEYLFEVYPDEIQAQPDRGDGTCAQPQKRIEHRSGTVESVQSQALLRHL